MELTQQTAKHLRDVFFGGNWTGSNMKDNLAGLTWEQATTQVNDLNTIAKLTYHVGYYVGAVLKVLQGGPLDAHDKFSFDLPPVHSQADWDALLNKTLADAESLAALIETLPDDIYFQNFSDGKYGNYFRNLHGLIEHTHYHLGQIAVIRKMLLPAKDK